MTDTTTDCWETSADHALHDLWDAGVVARPHLEWLSTVEDSLPTFEELTDSAAFVRALFLHIGYTTIVNNEFITFDDMLDLVISKQWDYGHGNIAKFGLIGIVVRLSDKIERLKNLLSTGASPSNESLDDTKMDIVGYCILALMLIDGTFMKPLGGAHTTDPF